MCGSASEAPLHAAGTAGALTCALYPLRPNDLICHPGPMLSTTFIPELSTVQTRTSSLGLDIPQAPQTQLIYRSPTPSRSCTSSSSSTRHSYRTRTPTPTHVLTHPYMCSHNCTCAHMCAQTLTHVLTYPYTCSRTCVHTTYVCPHNCTCSHA